MTDSEKVKQISENIRNEMSKPQYTVHSNCYNCGVDSTVKINRGVPLDSVECPNCGCKSLIAKL